MAEQRVDPSGNTTQFQAFADQDEEPERRSRVPLIVAAVVALLLIAGVVALALG